MMSKEEIGSVERDGFKLRYVIEGTGFPALVIGSSMYYPRSFSKAIREHLRLAFVDWRGFAESAPPTFPNVTLDTILDDIEHVRKHIGFDQCIIIGHSAHALLALEYAKKYPQHVSHVVMIGISPNLSPEMANLAEQNWQESVCPERKAALEKRIVDLPEVVLEGLSPSERFVAWCARRAPQTWYDYDFDSSILWEGIHPHMPMLDTLYGVILRDLDITLCLETFTKPVFLALGRFDYIIAPPSSWDSIRAKFQDLTVRVFERSGHSPQYEEAPLFDEELLQFLKKRLDAMGKML